MKKTKMAVVGEWRISGMEVWDANYFDMEVPAHISIRDDLTGPFQSGLEQSNIDARVSVDDDRERLEFSWAGNDEDDPASGRGWMQVTGDQAEGRIFFHLGDDSAFTAARQGSDTETLLGILRHGDDQVAHGNVKPTADVVARLHRVK